jgi:ankyrin repeat protein
VETLRTEDRRSELHTESTIEGRRRRSSDSDESQKTIEMGRPAEAPSASSPGGELDQLSLFLDRLLQPKRRPGPSHITTESSRLSSVRRSTSWDPEELLSGHGGSLSLKDLLESALGNRAGGRKERYKVHAKWSPLHASAGNGRLAQVKALISRGADVDAREDDGWSPLMLAAQNGHVDVVRELIDNGASVNHMGDDGVTALRQAAQGKHVEIVELLLSHKADPNKMTEEAGSALISAITGKPDKTEDKRNMIPIMTALIRAGARIDLGDKDRDSPLGLACMAGEIEAARLLLAAGADVNTANNSGYSPLTYAAYTANSKLVKLLLENHAEVDHRTHNDWTPLQLAAQFLKDETLEVVKLLVEAGADVNARTDTNATALHVASQKGDPDILRYLIEKGANVNAKTMDGRTPLFQAACNRHLEAIEILAAAGADVNIATDDDIQLNILHIAIVNNDPEMVERFLKLGVDPNAKARGKDTPLALASSHDDDKVFFILLAHGADVR